MNSHTQHNYLLLNLLLSSTVDLDDTGLLFEDEVEITTIEMMEDDMPRPMLLSAGEICGHIARNSMYSFLGLLFPGGPLMAVPFVAGFYLLVCGWFIGGSVMTVRVRTSRYI